MSIWTARPRHRASARSAPNRTARWAAAAAVPIVIVVSLLNAAAAVAAPSLSLTPTVTAGSGTVSFAVGIAGNASTDTAYLCFGDEAVNTCDATHAGASVDIAAASATGGTTVVHTYAAEGPYSAVLYEVQPGTPDTVTASPAAPVTVTIDGTARLSAISNGLTATFDGSTSTAAVGDTWWACFGESATCSQAAPDASGTVTATAPPMNLTTHTYAKPGTYPASLTVIGTAITSTAPAAVTVNFPDPTAVLTANQVTGSGTLSVIFDGSASSVGTGDTWAFCYGDVAGCTQTNPDAAGNISAAGPTVQLPNTAHSYLPGKFTATLWVSIGAVTNSATVAVTVTNPIAGPDATCSLSGTTRTCALFAKDNGSVTLGAAKTVIPFWGFTLNDAATPVLGGPEIVATEGEHLAFTVKNELKNPLSGNVSISVPGLMGAPDTVGVAEGSTGPSNPAGGSFTLIKPGTYVYQAGLTPGGARQVAMGMAGILIVRPSGGGSVSARCAYDSVVNANCVTNKDPNNYFDREKLVAVNELDANFNADPFGHDTGDYHPTNYFVDGVSYDSAKPALDPTDLNFDPAVNSVRLDAAPGDRVLLRYADLGLREHSMDMMELKQTETARDANLLPGTAQHQTEFLNAGETADAFVTIPAGATAGSQYPLSDAGFHLTTGDEGGVGGMYTYLYAVSGATASDIGPVGTAAHVDTTFSAAAPDVDNGQVPTLDVTGSFTAQKPAAGATPTVGKIQWALDGVPGAGGAWQSSSAAPNPTGATSASFAFTIDSATLTSLLGSQPGAIFGDHTVWLQAIDSAGNPGPAIGATFTMARRDAVISTLSLDPTVTNGSTGSTQGPPASTTISPPSTTLPRSATPYTLNVKSTAGFPADCSSPGCVLTVGLTISNGPATGDIQYGTLTYTGLTPTSFTGVVTPVALRTGTAFSLGAGNTVALDVVPAGYLAVDATATAALPGWVVSDAQACVVLASTAPALPAGAVPLAADAAKCGGTSSTVSELALNTTDSLAAVNGFIAPPVLPSTAPDGAHYWVMVRAQEGPASADCTVAGTCRWSPWLYYNTDGSTATATYQPLTVVHKGPDSSTPVMSPNPSNGLIPAAGNLGLVDSFDVTATGTSAWANIALGEVFLAPATRLVSAGTPSAPPECTNTSVQPYTPTGCVIFGQGAEMTTTSGFWNTGQTATASAFLPLSELQGLKDGLLRVWVHYKDAAGNWGGFTPADLTLDTTPPIINGLAGGSPANRTLTAHDVPTNGVSGGITGAEWYSGADPGAGNGRAITLSPPGPANSAAVQTYTVTGIPSNARVRVQDAAGNWSTTVTAQ